jgi:hypothetical protein
MTVIAWRAGVMACDSCWASNGTQNVSMIKIKRLSSGALLGSAGENDAREMEMLLDRIKDPRKLPSRTELASCKLDYEGLIAFPKGSVYMISTCRMNESGYPDLDSADDEGPDHGVWPAATMGGYAACGSGGEFALAAMDGHPSVTARKAVEVAIKRSIHCRGPIHVMRLEAKRP